MNYESYGQNLHEIMNELPPDEILAQLAEEASELSQAALKLRRVIDGRNPTPKTREQAIDNLAEEVADVMLCEDLVNLKMEDVCRALSVQDRLDLKAARWARRLYERKCEECQKQN